MLMEIAKPAAPRRVTQKPLLGGKIVVENTLGIQ